MIKNKNLFHKLLVVLYLPFYGILFFLAEYLVPSGSHHIFDTVLPIDAKIPFVPGFIYIYISWYIFMVLIILYCFFKDEESYYRFFMFIIITYTVTMIFDIIYPNGESIREWDYVNEKGLTSKLYQFIYANDTETNVLPSMHCLGSFCGIMTIMTAKSLKNKPWIKVIMTFWGILIVLSTLFTKQHAIIDDIASLMISFILFYPIFIVSWERKPLKN